MGQTDKRKLLSLRQKAIASLALVFVVLISYFLYFTVVNQHRSYEEEVRNAAQMKAEFISLAISEYLFQKDRAFLREFVDRVESNNDIEYLRIVDNEGMELITRGRSPVVPEDGSGSSSGSGLWTTIKRITGLEGLFHGSGHFYEVSVLVLHGKEGVGRLSIGVNTRRVNRRLARAAHMGIVFILVTILIGSLFTYFFERRMRGSLTKLIQTTGKMANGDLSQRVRIEIGDEVEALGESFNRMARVLSEKEKELLEARNTMVSMFNVITAGIAFISKGYEVIQANPAYVDLMKEIAGSSSGKGQKCFELFCQEEAFCRNCPGEAAMNTGEPKDMEQEVTLKNGERHVLWIHAYPVHNEGEKPAGFVEYILDITRQRKLEDELKTYTEHLEEISQEQTRKLKEAQVQIAHQEKMAALGQMAAGVAHEIGNPLSALSSLVRYIEKEAGDRISDGKIQVMKEQTDRISVILREMTDFSRPATYRKSLTHCNQVIQSALGISKYDRRLKGIHVTTSLDSEIPALKLDGDQLLQVFMNIIFNAADAMKGEGTLTVTSRLEKNSVVVNFEDTGPGIPVSLLSRVFEPFFTTKDVGEGTGLGLSVSYGLMQNIGGAIRASNRKNGGSMFTVEVPLANPKES